MMTISEGRSTEVLSAQLEAFIPPLSSVEQRISLELIRLLSRGKPASLDGLAKQLDLTLEEVERVLSAWTGVKRDANGDVQGYWGFDLEPTQHELDIEGTTLYAWGAWDALFLPELIGRSVGVRSTCPVTRQGIDIEVGLDRILQADSKTVLSFLFPPQGTPLHETDAHTYCRFVHFFSSTAAGSAWCARHSGTFLISLEQGFQLGHLKNRRRYAHELGGIHQDGPA